MKISLAWLFDYIDADWKKIDVADLAAKFNQTTAEIEFFKKISIDLKKFTLAQVTGIKGSTTHLHSSEWDEDMQLATHDGVKEGEWYAIKQKDDCHAWATGFDFHCYKDHTLPALWVAEDDRAGGWKKSFEAEDYILEIDNKSITNRPDMWGHYGIAREVAAILQKQLKPVEELFVEKPLLEFDSKSKATNTNPFTIKIDAPEVCKRFSGLYIDHVEFRPSLLWMANRLLKVDSKPINTFVDFTNYVMLDSSQPMHAFDAEILQNKTIVPRMAKKREKMVLLDDEEIELSSEDLVITDGKQPIALGGVMGGKLSGVAPTTSSLFLESANFDATIIRKTSTRHKIRTESSARFEKTLDPNQNVDGIKRFLKLLDDAGMGYQAADEIISVGKPAPAITIQISHEFLEKHIGAELPVNFVERVLTPIGFGVSKEQSSYTITVPTYRSSKDVTIKEDIVEEVARFFGYSNIPHAMPHMQLQARDMDWVHRRRKIKHTLAYACQMRELANYSLFDEVFLQELNWQPNNTLEVQDPVSQNWRRTVTTLMPGLFKAIKSNVADRDSLRFFECGRTWTYTKEVNEKKVLAGIIFEQKQPVNFYDGKAELQKLFDTLGMQVQWQKVDKPEKPWCMPYQTAQLVHDGVTFGYAGKISQAFTHALFPGDAFVFELSLDHLLNSKAPTVSYEPASKYQDVERDVSMFVPLKVTVDTVLTAMRSAHENVVDAELVDFFEKKEWGDKRSLTCRFVVRDYEKTLTKEEIDAVYDNVAGKLERLGAEIR